MDHQPPENDLEPTLVKPSDRLWIRGDMIRPISLFLHHFTQGRRDDDKPFRPHPVAKRLLTGIGLGEEEWCKFDSGHRRRRVFDHLMALFPDLDSGTRILVTVAVEAFVPETSQENGRMSRPYSELFRAALRRFFTAIALGELAVQDLEQGAPLDA